jgi:hypothetical protein
VVDLVGIPGVCTPGAHPEARPYFVAVDHRSPVGLGAVHAMDRREPHTQEGGHCREEEGRQTLGKATMKTLA